MQNLSFTVSRIKMIVKINFLWSENCKTNATFRPATTGLDHTFVAYCVKVARSPNVYSPPGVELEFEKLLVNIFGSEFIEAFRHKRPAGWVDLMIAFESRKRAATPFKNNALNVSLPFSFIDYYKKKKVSQKEATPVIMTPFCIIMYSKMCSFSMIYLK